MDRATLKRMVNTLATSAAGLFAGKPFIGLGVLLIGTLLAGLIDQGKADDDIINHNTATGQTPEQPTA